MSPSPLTARLRSILVGLPLWVLWIWLIVPAPVSEEARRRIVETSLWPSIHVGATLIVVYAFAVVGCRCRRPRPPSINPEIATPSPPTMNRPGNHSE